MAERLLADWENAVSRFVKVMPHDYKRALDAARTTPVSTGSGFLTRETEEAA